MWSCMHANSLKKLKLLLYLTVLWEAQHRGSGTPPSPGPISRNMYCSFSNAASTLLMLASACPSMLLFQSMKSSIGRDKTEMVFGRVARVATAPPGSDNIARQTEDRGCPWHEERNILQPLQIRAAENLSSKLNTAFFRGTLWPFLLFSKQILLYPWLRECLVHLLDPLLEREPGDADLRMTAGSGYSSNYSLAILLLSTITLALPILIKGLILPPHAIAVPCAHLGEEQRKMFSATYSCGHFLFTLAYILPPLPLCAAAWTPWPCWSTLTGRTPPTRQTLSSLKLKIHDYY